MKAEKTIEQNYLKEAWEKLQAEKPGIRIRDAATQLNVSEAELLVLGIGENVIRLEPKFAEIFARLKPLGRVMALTRNEEIVHERKGVYENFEAVQGHGNVGLVLGEDIDLRIFFAVWASAFAVTSEGRAGLMRSLQFFDKSGNAIHKIFLTDSSDLAEYEKLVTAFKSEDQSSTITVEPKKPLPVDRPDSEIDVEGFRLAWTQLKDTHDFFPLLRKFGVGREQALRVADREWAYPVATETYQSVFAQAAADKLPIMVFVGNDGMIQIHTGPIEKAFEARGWFNIMDEPFNLHMNAANITTAWVVKKPTDDGIVTSLELFNGQGENVALIFGKRKPGIPEMEEWRELVKTIPAV